MRHDYGCLNPVYDLSRDARSAIRRVHRDRAVTSVESGGRRGAAIEDVKGQATLHQRHHTK